MTTPNEDEPIPLVIVEGFLSGAGALLWGNFEQYLNQDSNARGKTRRRTIFARYLIISLPPYATSKWVASVGPVSSLHDRACELYYALLGGTVDYGVQHSDTHRHARYGRTNVQGLYPAWSQTRPLHFFGHSMGGSTIIKLQSLIKQGHFGPHAHPGMVLSVNAVSAPFRGTQAVYILGERTDAAPAVRPLSFGSAMGKGVHILSFLSPLLPSVLDMHGDCRALTYRDTTFSSLLKQLWKSDWAESEDATPFDATFQSADERECNSEGDVNPTTFYQSHVACMTRRRSGRTNTHSPLARHIISPLMYISSRITGAFDYSTLQPSPSFCRHKSDSAYHPESEMGEEYWANDGVVPVFSQWHPLPCSRTTCLHLPPAGSAAQKNASNDYPGPGIWYVNQDDNAHHMSIVPLWTATDRQRQFWPRLGRWLDAVERTRELCKGESITKADGIHGVTRGSCNEERKECGVWRTAESYT
ncbi:alpha/beta-hydrolase [Mycena sp. CBHHK59/15]|nr:alpha/beta-hydrolase [Mycena sp. CBHHK59/15]